MADSPQSFRAVIELWETREAMASELGAQPRTVSKWWQRDKIPSQHWGAVINTDRARAAGVSAELLTALDAREVLDGARA